MTSYNNSKREKAKAKIDAQHIDNFIITEYEIVELNNKPFKIMSDLNKDRILDYVVLLVNKENNKDYSNAKIITVSIF
ncbi:hypothetical protein [Lacinutrix sp.]|uniref:hypothetical protein n=1 Tax=Lacinutrix sp. TaxID=1937692 RepID=UPI0025C63B74|nr:hypothetical protein [Lacinutrix sp.]